MSHIEKCWAKSLLTTCVKQGIIGITNVGLLIGSWREPRLSRYRGGAARGIDAQGSAALHCRNSDASLGVCTATPDSGGTGAVARCSMPCTMVQPFGRLVFIPTPGSAPIQATGCIESCPGTTPRTEHPSPVRMGHDSGPAVAAIYRKAKASAA